MNKVVKSKLESGRKRTHGTKLNGLCYVTQKITKEDVKGLFFFELSSFMKRLRRCSSRPRQVYLEYMSAYTRDP